MAEAMKQKPAVHSALSFSDSQKSFIKLVPDSRDGVELDRRHQASDRQAAADPFDVPGNLSGYQDDLRLLHLRFMHRRAMCFVYLM